MKKHKIVRFKTFFGWVSFDSPKCWCKQKKKRGQFGFANVVLTLALILFFFIFLPGINVGLNVILNSSAVGSGNTYGGQIALVLFGVITFVMLGAIGMNLARSST